MEGREPLLEVSHTTISREKEADKYDIFIGTVGSLLISHLALNKIQKIKEIFTSVNQSSIF
jgi:hypothetical protein